MSIQDEINRINQNIANTYSALGDMGATLPQAQNSANMASAVRTIPQSGGDNSTFIVSAVGTIDIDLSTMVVTVKSVFGADKGISEIIEAALTGKQVGLSVDISASAKELFGIPAAVDVDINIYFTLTTLNSLSEITFSSVSDLSGSGIPVCTRVSCDLQNSWSVISTPILSEASDNTFLITGYGTVSMGTDGISLSVSSISHTYSEILTAFNEGKNISLVSDTNTGAKMSFCLVSVDANAINFSCNAHAGTDFLLIGVSVNNDDSVTVFNKIV